MDKKELKKRKRKRIRLIKSLVLVVAFVVAIGATFGVTMSYFGGKSKEVNYDMILKTGLYINTPTTEQVEATAYVVPSQVITTQCELSVKSSKAATDAAVADGKTGSNGLLRAIITFGDEEGTGATLTGSGKESYFPVKLGNTVIGNFVKYTDNNYYLMTGTTIGTNDEMYVIEASTGEKTFTFDLRVSVPSSLTNADGGKEISLKIVYQVIQADFFNDSTTATPKTVANAKTIFDDNTVKNEQSYTK